MLQTIKTANYIWTRLSANRGLLHG